MQRPFTNKSFAFNTIAAVTAAATTVALFKAVVALADPSKAEMIAARIRPTAIAATDAPTQQR